MCYYDKKISAYKAKTDTQNIGEINAKAQCQKMWTSDLKHPVTAIIHHVCHAHSDVKI